MVTNELIDRGLNINGTVLKLVHTKDLTFKERLAEVKPLLVPTLLNTTSVFNFNDTQDYIDINNSQNIIQGLLYLVDILRGKAFVIKVYEKGGLQK